MKKKFALDVVINTVASYVPIIVLQLIIYPILAQRIGDGPYGEIITIISLFTIISHPFGNSLNNIRLLANEEDVNPGEYKKIIGVLVLVDLVIIAIILPIYIKNLTVVDYVSILLISVLFVIKAYLVVFFRVYLDYKGYLINNIIFCLGYLVGFGLYLLTGLWELIFILGYAISIANIIFKYDFHHKKFDNKVKLNKTIIKDYIYIYIGNMINSALSYMDKLIIYPLIGAGMVSIYYAASFSGKIIMLGIASLSSVLLSYITRYKAIENKVFLKILGIIAVVCTLGYGVCVTINPIIVRLLYPQWMEEAGAIIPITSAISMVAVMNSLLHPFVLKFCKKQMQIVINGINLFLYVALSVLFYHISGIMGFCFGILISHIVKIIITVFIYIRTKE